MSLNPGSITLPEITNLPANPPDAGKFFFYIRSGSVRYMNSSGTEFILSTGITAEEVEDIVGALVAGGTGISVVYNDAGGTLTVSLDSATQTALSDAASHILNTSNPHSTTKAQVGLGNVDNTSDLNKPISTATQSALDLKQNLDADLTAVAGLATQGLITRTGAGTATTRSVAAGTGISVSNGDGVSGNPTVALSNVGTAGTYGSATATPVITTNAQGQVSSAITTAIAIPSSQVTDFSEAVDDRVAALVVAGTGITATYNDPANTLTIAATVTQYTDEQAQDAVGTILTDSASVDFTYNDAGNTISAAVLPAGVDHNSLNNYVANRHIDHSAVSISAGTGLTGGGDITTTRTLNLANTAVTAAAYGSATQNGTFTVDAQGRLTAASNVLITPAFSSITTTPTTLTGYGITDAQPLDSDLTALAGLSGTGLISRTGTGTATTRTLTAGAGITVSNGDGVSGNPTVAITNNITAGSAGSATQVPAITYNAQGQLTVVTPTNIAIPSSQITDFNEAAQDAVGAILTDTASVDFTYNDAGNTISAAVLPAGVNHDALQNFVANKHIDHSAVIITAGVGLSGGGDITSSRTIDLENTAVTPGTYGSASVYPVITVDQQGRITSASTQAVPGGALTAKNATQLTNSSNATLTSIPNMTLTLAANTTYLINVYFIHRSANINTGIGISFGGGTVTPTATTGYGESAITTTTSSRLNFISHTTVNVFSATAVVNQDQIANFELVVVVGGTGGTFIPQFRSENNGTLITLQTNSFIEAKVI